MASRSSRYYSGTYSSVPNPENAQHAGEGQFGDYEDYQQFQKVQDLEFAEPQSTLPPRTRRQGWSQWTGRKKLMVLGGAVLAVIVIGVAVGVGVGLGTEKDQPYTYVPANGDLKVTNDAAFEQGGATHADPSNTNDGIGAGEDKYTYYSGPASNFPDHTKWISFENLWAGNLHSIKTSCKTNHHGANNSPQMIQSIYDAIQNRAAASLVDHRFILATVLQESAGCARVKATDNGIANPGLMQSHDGTDFNAQHANQSIYDMIQDGTQGTAKGDGLVQNLDYYNSTYAAARGYNSGYIPKSGNLSEAAGATACYVSDLANRLTGWANATSTCPGDQ